MSGLMSGSALERLVELSVCKKARLDSDTTLVAVITAVSYLISYQDRQVKKKITIVKICWLYELGFTCSKCEEIFYTSG